MNQEQQSQMEKLPAPVYYVQSETDDTVLVGLNVVHDGTVISWQDTTKERRMAMEQILSDNPNDFCFKATDSSGGNTYRFTPLDLETYRLTVKPQLFNAGDFTDVDAMNKAFQEAQNNAW